MIDFSVSQKRASNIEQAADRLIQEANPISVTLGVGLASYQQTLPEALLREGMLRRLFRFGIDLEVLEPNGNHSLRLLRRFRLFRIADRLLWAVWRRLPGVGRRRLPIVATSWWADKLTSRWLPESRIFHGWTAVSLASLLSAKAQKAITLIENPMMHPQYWQREVLAECAQFRIRPEHCDVVLPKPLITRREHEFQICDKIIVPSEVARQSFEELGYGAKVAVVHFGVDHQLFRPPATQRDLSIFRVCYVGRVELAKGIIYLLEAWKRLRLPRAELVIVGEIRPEVRSFVRNYASKNIRFEGLVMRESLVQFYQQSSLLVFPSVNEGLAVALLEAMACGLPVVATIASGANECITPGKEGLIIPPRNVEALAEAISWCHQHLEELATMGKAARQRIEDHFTLEHYVKRQIAMYRSIMNEA